MRRALGIVVVACGGLCQPDGLAADGATTPTEASSEHTGANGEATGAGVTPEQNDAIDAAVPPQGAASCRAAGTDEYEKNHDRKLEGDRHGRDERCQPSGQPANVRVLKSTMNNASIEGCVIQTVTSWSFPELTAPVPYMRTVHLGAQF